MGCGIMDVLMDEVDLIVDVAGLGCGGSSCWMAAAIENFGK